jgi:hypothetical protein
MKNNSGGKPKNLKNNVCNCLIFNNKKIFSFFFKKSAKKFGNVTLKYYICNILILQKISFKTKKI